MDISTQLQKLKSSNQSKADDALSQLNDHFYFDQAISSEGFLIVVKTLVEMIILQNHTILKPIFLPCWNLICIYSEKKLWDQMLLKQQSKALQKQKTTSLMSCSNLSEILPLSKKNWKRISIL